jgi:hypothetical protein
MTVCFKWAQGMLHKLWKTIVPHHIRRREFEGMISVSAAVFLINSYERSGQFTWWENASNPLVTRNTIVFVQGKRQTSHCSAMDRWEKWASHCVHRFYSYEPTRKSTVRTGKIFHQQRLTASLDDVSLIFDVLEESNGTISMKIRCSYPSVMRRRSFDLIRQIFNLDFELCLNIFELERNHSEPRDTSFNNWPDCDRLYLPDDTHTDRCTSVCNVPRQMEDVRFSRDQSIDTLWPMNQRPFPSIANR